MKYIRSYENINQFDPKIEIDRLLESELDESKILYYKDDEFVILDYIENDNSYTCMRGLENGKIYYAFFINSNFFKISKKQVEKLFIKLKNLYIEWVNIINKYNL